MPCSDSRSACEWRRRPPVQRPPAIPPPETAAYRPPRRSDRRTDNAAKTERRRLTLSRSQCSSRLRFGAFCDLLGQPLAFCDLLGQPLFHRLEGLKQPAAGNTKQVEAEGGVLHVKFLDLAVADAQDQA